MKRSVLRYSRRDYIVKGSFDCILMNLLNRSGHQNARAFYASGFITNLKSFSGRRFEGSI